MIRPSAPDKTPAIGTSKLLINSLLTSKLFIRAMLPTKEVETDATETLYPQISFENGDALSLSNRSKANNPNQIIDTIIDNIAA